MSYKNDDGEVTLAKVHFRAPKTVRHKYLFMSIVYVPERLICQMR